MSINVKKSITVFILLMVLVLILVILIVNGISKYKENILSKKYVILTICYSIITVLCLTLFGDYVYPFERRIEPVLIAEFSVPEKYVLKYPGQEFWHGAYEEYGLYAGSFYFNTEKKTSIYGFDWPPMDFDRYNYIITYGQKIKTLSYNVWETIDEPVRTGAKVGHMILCDEFEPNKGYIYQIPKIRIENDINDHNSPWD